VTNQNSVHEEIKEQIEVTEFLLLISAESYGLGFAVQKHISSYTEL
jgi:hypothetical protein